MRHQIAEFSREHKWEIILGLVFAVLFGVVWEVGKHTLEHAQHVEPERLAAGTLRVMTAINLKTDAQRKAVAEWQKDHPNTTSITPDLAILATASGFAVSDDGWIVTARHVVRPKFIAPLLAATGAKPYIGILYPPHTERIAAVVEVDDEHDTALLKVVNPPPGTFLVLGDPKKPRRLDPVLAVGYPDAADFSGVFDPTITEGEISKPRGEGPRGMMLQTTAPIGSGNSGGPLIHANGRVVGINIGTPKDSRLVLGLSVSIEYAAAMLARHGAVLPSAYETEGVLRQPWIVWTGVIAAALLILAFLGVLLRFLWRRRFKVEADPPYARVGIRFAALVLDLALIIHVWLALIVLLIVASGSFMPQYCFILGLLPAWCVYVALCEWRWGATIGKRVAGLQVRSGEANGISLGRAFLRSAAHFVSALPLLIGFVAAAFEPRRRAWHDRIADTVVVEPHKHSPWAMLAAGAVATGLTLFSAVVFWGYLGHRAVGDLEQVHWTLWKATHRPADTKRLLATANDRLAFLRWTPVPLEDSVHYRYGLDLMLAGFPRHAYLAFQSAAGAPWETFGPSTGVPHSSEASAAATKTGWCYLETGDLRSARQRFELVETTSDLDAALGLGVILMRTGQREAARAACQQAEKIDKLGVGRIRSSTPGVPLGEPYALTPSQLREVQQLLASCGDARVTPAPGSR